MSDPNDRKLCGQSGRLANNHRNKSAWPQNHHWLDQPAGPANSIVRLQTVCICIIGSQKTSNSEWQGAEAIKSQARQLHHPSSAAICPLHAQDSGTGYWNNLGEGHGTWTWAKDMGSGQSQTHLVN